MSDISRIYPLINRLRPWEKWRDRERLLGIIVRIAQRRTAINDIQIKQQFLLLLRQLFRGCKESKPHLFMQLGIAVLVDEAKRIKLSGKDS
jgi:hypothetical protein